MWSLTSGNLAAATRPKKRAMQLPNMTSAIAGVCYFDNPRRSCVSFITPFTPPRVSSAHVSVSSPSPNRCGLIMDTGSVLLE